VWSSTPATFKGLEPGATFGPFVVLGKIGKGGMGQVFRVRDPGTNRELALKLSLDRHDPVNLARFRNEGVVTATLRHPGIIGIHSAGEVDGLPYLAYELVGGAQELDDAWKGLGLRARVELIRDAARAVGYAHEHQVVHRDLKPANILVDGAGRVRVADFGLASMVGLERLTQTGQMVGTPLYMAPEQLLGVPPTPIVDVWALGVILYEASCEELPLQASAIGELMAKLAVAKIEPPHAVRPTLPRDLSAVCMTALARGQLDRYPDAGALADDLDRWLAGEPVSARSPGGLRALLSGKARLALAGTLAAAVLLGGGVLVALGLDPAQAPAPKAQATKVADPPPTRAPTPDAPARAPADEDPAWPPWDPPPDLPLEELLPPLGAETPQFIRDQHAAALEERSGSALASMAHAYRKGHIPRDYPRAIALYRRLIEDPRERLEVLTDLGMTILHAYPDQPEAIEVGLAHLERAGEEGDPEGWLHLGRAYEQGKPGLPPDPARARAVYERGAETNHAPLLADLGRVLMDGIGGPREPERAAEFLERGIARGDKRAQFVLGRALYEGEHLPRDEERGLNLVREAARQGHSEAVELVRRIEASASD
jgi:serine/threonine protein kinase